MLPEGASPEQRASELVAAAYHDGRLAAVSTATIGEFDFLKARFAILRGATDPEFRRRNVRHALAGTVRATLRSWASDHPEEKVAGCIAFVQPADWGEFARLPVWPESRLELAGYDQHGRQIRIFWFDEFRFDGPGGEGAPPPPPPEPPPPPADIVLRPAWQRHDAGIEKDAAAFWRRLGNLPRDVSPERRAKEAVVAAYRDGRIVGMVTADVGVLPQVRARLAMLRASVDADLRRSYLGSAMTVEARALLESWAAANPNERLAGIGGIVESPDLVVVQRQPYWPWPRMGVVGFTADGRQIRVSWFRDFRLV